MTALKAAALGVCGTGATALFLPAGDATPTVSRLLLSGWARIAVITAVGCVLLVLLGVYVHHAFLRHRAARRREILEDEVVLSARTIADPDQRTDKLIRLIETHCRPPEDPPPATGLAGPP